MTLTKVSAKQKTVLKWAFMPSTRGKYKAIICDGAVRSGKTISMVTGFILWAMRYFDGCNFGICGKTVASAERNIIRPARNQADITSIFSLSYYRSEHVLIARGLNRENRFYIFGGKDESSYALIQGITLCGVLLDEVALMPRSFVEQAIARTLSEPEARIWFNCNPEGPGHWFYQEWVCEPEKHRALRLHFTMEDNPALSPEAIQEAASMYTGIFRDRYILGLWVKAEGLVYPMFTEDNITHEHGERGEWYVSMDYGTMNPTAMGLWRISDGTATLEKEYYYNGRAEMEQKTDEEYYSELEKLVGDVPLKRVIIDPSAASFKATIRKHKKFHTQDSDNSVVDGIRYTATMLKDKKLLIHESCKNTIKEFGLYSWDESKPEDAVIKENDHAMDMCRYLCYTLRNRLKHETGLPAYYTR